MLTSEPVGGRSRVTELPCYFLKFLNALVSPGVDESRQLSLSRLFASSTGVSLVSRALQQMAQSRLDLSRDLLLLLTMATQMADQVTMGAPLYYVKTKFSCLFMQQKFLMKII